MGFTGFYLATMGCHRKMGSEFKDWASRVIEYYLLDCILFILVDPVAVEIPG